MNKFNILIAMLVCLNICGCSDFLEEDPKGKLTTDNFYNSESDARQAINGVYRRLSDSWVTGYKANPQRLAETRKLGRSKRTE